MSHLWVREHLKFLTLLIGLFLLIMARGRMFTTSSYNFALRVEIGECDTCALSNFPRPAYTKKNYTFNFNGEGAREN